MTRLWPTGFRGKLTTLIVLTVTPLFLAGTGGVVYFAQKDVRQTRVSAISGNLRAAALAIDDAMESARSDVLFLAACPPSGGLVRAWAHGGIDPKDGSTEAYWRGRMTLIWAAAVETKRIYDYVSFLDRNGMEVVRVDSEHERAVPVPTERLQNQRDGDAIAGTARLAKGQFYVSPANLSREFGEVEVPHKMVIRVATPVFDDAGHRQGVVVASVLFSEVVRVLVERREALPQEFFVADSGGFYLYNQAVPDDTWGGPQDLNTGKGVKKDYPNDWTAILKGSAGAAEIGERVVVVDISHPWPDRNEFLVVGVAVPAAVAGLSMLQPQVAVTVLVSVALLALLLTVIVWPLGRSMVRPLSVLLGTVERFARGDLQARAPVETRDELGVLSRAFNDMAETIGTERARLEAEVRERTAKLETSGRVAFSMLQDAEAARAETAAVLKSLSESEREFKAIFDAAGDGMFLCDPANGELLRCNSACAQMLGVGQAEFSQLGIPELHPPEDLPFIVDEMKKFEETGEGRRTEIRFLRRDGSVFLTELIPSMISMSGRPVILVTFRDLTEAKRAAEAIESARAAAEEANRAKSAFLANMSHEIRTPMNAILGFAQVLRCDGALTEQQRQHVGTIMRSGEHLLALITDILQYSKIEAGRLSADESTFDLHALFDDLEVMFRMHAEAKHLRLLVEHCDRTLHYVVADEAKLRQIVQNLLANAVKFTEHGGVALRAAVVRSWPGEAATLRLVVEVEDTGPGIAPEEMGRLFQVFEQTESGRRTKSGTGLGLAISRKFAELLGGTLDVQSHVGHGSTFRLEIPIKEGAAASARSPLKPQRVTALEPGQPAFRVLVADDKEDNRAFLEALLGAVGFEVRTVEDGAQAVREFEVWRPPLILMDMRMPVMTGREAIGRIRGQSGGAAVKIIAVTASAFQEDRQQAITAGADDFLSKPFREEALFEKIRTLLGVRYRWADADGAVTPVAPAPLAAALRAEAAVLSEDLIARLRQATRSADLDRILELTTEADVESPVIAQEIRRLAAGFAYTDVLALLEHGKEA